jgi:hypothetical protein
MPKTPIVLCRDSKGRQFHSALKFDDATEWDPMLEVEIKAGLAVTVPPHEPTVAPVPVKAASRNPVRRSARGSLPPAPVRHTPIQQTIMFTRRDYVRFLLDAAIVGVVLGVWIGIALRVWG